MEKSVEYQLGAADAGAETPLAYVLDASTVSQVSPVGTRSDVNPTQYPCGWRVLFRM
jgi:hypothetical protein